MHCIYLPSTYCVNLDSSDRRHCLDTAPLPAAVYLLCFYHVTGDYLPEIISLACASSQIKRSVGRALNVLPSRK